MVLDAAGLSLQSRTRVRTAEDRTREAWQPWRGRAFLAAWHGQTRRAVSCPVPVSASYRGGRRDAERP
jgi:hypothetical protein